jgi:hypothetical protein
MNVQLAPQPAQKPADRLMAYSAKEKMSMIKSLVDKWRAKQALKGLEKNPLYQVAIHTIRETLSDKSAGLGKNASQKFKEELAGDILKVVTEVVLADNQIMVNRVKLADAVVMTAKFQVLVMPSEIESEEEVTGLRGKPGITGQLKAQIREIAEKDETIKRLAWSLDNPTDKDIYEACLFQYWTYGLSAQVHQMLRLQLNDYHQDPQKDWYRPFMEAMCAWEEHNFREAIGLPGILAEQDEYGSNAALKYSTFINMVLDGSKYPNFEFQEYYSHEKDKSA